MASPDPMKKAESTYGNFIGALKWVTPVIAATVLFLILIISP